MSERTTFKSEFLEMWNEDDGFIRWMFRFVSVLVSGFLLVIVLAVLFTITPLGDNTNTNPRVGWVDGDGYEYKCEGPNMVYKKDARYTASVDVIEDDPRCYNG